MVLMTEVLIEMEVVVVVMVEGRVLIKDPRIKYERKI
jgi:hypothetical protein